MTFSGQLCGAPDDLGGCSSRFHDPRRDSAVAQTGGQDYFGSMRGLAGRVAAMRQELHL